MTICFDAAIESRPYRLLGGFLAVFDQLTNAIRHLRALTDPVIGTRGIKAETLFLTTGNRVEKANALNETAITGIAAVSHRDMVKRTLFGATAGQTNRNHSDLISIKQMLSAPA